MTYWLIWSNEHGSWWGPAERGYTRSIEEAGRYTYAEAKKIVDKASVDGQLYSTVLGDDGAYLRSYPEVMVQAPRRVVESDSREVPVMRRKEAQSDTVWLADGRCNVQPDGTCTGTVPCVHTPPSIAGGRPMAPVEYGDETP